MSLEGENSLLKSRNNTAGNGKKQLKDREYLNGTADNRVFQRVFPFSRCGVNAILPSRSVILSQFNNLQVSYVLSVYHKTNQCAYLLKAGNACCAGIYTKTVECRVVHYL